LFAFTAVSGGYVKVSVGQLLVTAKIAADVPELVPLEAVIVPAMQPVGITNWNEVEVTLVGVAFHDDVGTTV
jgi:hypothetical protein